MSVRPAPRQSTLSFGGTRAKISKPTHPLPSKRTKTTPPPTPVSPPAELPPPTAVAAVAAPTDPHSLKALSLPASSLQQFYDTTILSTRTSKPVHQEHLSLDEKILRHFDLSSQFGPCIGMSRVRRWRRAQRLGLEPPVEYLAVALMEEGKGGEGVGVFG